MSSSYPYLDGSGTNHGREFSRQVYKESPPKLGVQLAAQGAIGAGTTAALDLDTNLPSECTLPIWNVSLSGNTIRFPYAGAWRVDFVGTVTAGAAGQYIVGLGSGGAITVPMVSMILPSAAAYSFAISNTFFIPTAGTSYIVYGNAITGGMATADNATLRVTYLGNA